MEIISYEKLMSYILMVKEMEMNPNYTPTKEQTIIANRIHQQMENDQNLKNLIDILLNLRNVSEMSRVYSEYASGKPILKREVIKENSGLNIEYQANEKIGDYNSKSSSISIPKNVSLHSGTRAISKPKVFTKVRNKKAGYIDALVLALITGFAGGIVTTTILMMCR